MHRDVVGSIAYGRGLSRLAKGRISTAPPTPGRTQGNGPRIRPGSQRPDTREDDRSDLALGLRSAVLRTGTDSRSDGTGEMRASQKCLRLPRVSPSLPSLS